jgi:hypothetical protein
MTAAGFLARRSQLAKDDVGTDPAGSPIDTASGRAACGAFHRAESVLVQRRWMRAVSRSCFSRSAPARHRCRFRFRFRREFQLRDAVVRNGTRAAHDEEFHAVVRVANTGRLAGLRPVMSFFQNIGKPQLENAPEILDGHIAKLLARSIVPFATVDAPRMLFASVATCGRFPAPAVARDDEDDLLQRILGRGRLVAAAFQHLGDHFLLAHQAAGSERGLRSETSWPQPICTRMNSLKCFRRHAGLVEDLAQLIGRQFVGAGEIRESRVHPAVGNAVAGACARLSASALPRSVRPSRSWSDCPCGAATA